MFLKHEKSCTYNTYYSRSFTFHKRARPVFICFYEIQDRGLHSSHLMDNNSQKQVIENNFSHLTFSSGNADHFAVYNFRLCIKAFKVERITA